MQPRKMFVVPLCNSAVNVRDCMKAAEYLGKGVRLCNELPKENHTHSCSKGSIREYLHQENVFIPISDQEEEENAKNMKLNLSSQN